MFGTWIGTRNCVTFRWTAAAADLMALAFGPGGKLLAFIAPPAPDEPPSGNVRVWDVDGRKEAYSLSTAGTPRELAFSPDGGRIAIALSHEGWTEGIPDEKNRVEIWDTAARQELLAIPKRGTLMTGPVATHDGAPPSPPPPGWIGSLPNGLAFSPDGRRLAVVWQGQKDEVLALHDILNGGDARVLEAVAKTKETGLGQPVFSADGLRLTCSVNGSRVHVWDTFTGAELYTVRGHVSTPAVAFTGGGRLLTVGREGTVKDWAEPTPRPQPPNLNANNNYSPLAAAFTPSGLRLARAFVIEDGDKKSLEIRAWDEHGGAFAPHEAPICTDQDSAPRFQQGRESSRGRLRRAGHHPRQAASRAESVGPCNRQGAADGGQRRHYKRLGRQPPGRPRRLGDRRADAGLGRGFRQAAAQTRRSRTPCPCSRP